MTESTSSSLASAAYKPKRGQAHNFDFSRVPADMPVIDVHAHIYPDKIAAKAVAAVGKFYCYEDMSGEGTPDDLLNLCAGSPITTCIVHSVATTAKSVPSINTFLAEQGRLRPELISFGTMHQDFPDKEAEVERALELGIRGFKLHPDTQEVNMDDPRLMEFYEIIAGRVPLIMHTGDYRYDYSNPKRLVNVMNTFPDLVVNAAHLGGWSIYDIGFDILHERPLAEGRLFVDVSSAFAWVGRRHMRELVRMWGADRVMFGSDYPMWDPQVELNELLCCGLNDDELEQVLHLNAERFVGMSTEPIGASPRMAGHLG